MWSPDGAVYVFINDTDLLSCVGPEAFAGFGGNGYREGQVYRSEYGTSIMMLRYQPGVRFAEMYIGMRLASLANMRNPQIVDRRERTDLNRLAMSIGNDRTNIGEASFQSGAGDMRGYVMAATHRGIGGMWSAGVLGYAAPQSRTAEALQVFTHALQTMQGNQQWREGQGRTTGEVSGIVSRTANDVSQIMSGSYWSTQGSYGRIMQSGSDARRDQVRLQDPNTGETFVAAAGKNYYWRPAGTDERGVFGTDNTDRPNIDATQLLQVP